MRHFNYGHVNPVTQNANTSANSNARRKLLTSSGVASAKHKFESLPLVGHNIKPMDVSAMHALLRDSTLGA